MAKSKKKGVFGKILAALGIGAAAGAAAVYASNAENRKKVANKVSNVTKTAGREGKKVVASAKSNGKKVASAASRGTRSVAKTAKASAKKVAKAAKK